MKNLSKSTILKRIKSGRFCCPICGSYHTISTGNMAEYPERWIEENCKQCGQLVCISDNSPFKHICEDIKDSIKHPTYNKIIKWIEKDGWWNRPF